MRRKVARRQLPACVPFGLSDREFLILGEKNTGGGRRGYTHRSGNSIYVWIEEEHLAASWDRFLSALAVTNYFDASRDIPPTPPYSRPENTRKFH